VEEADGGTAGGAGLVVEGQRVEQGWWRDRGWSDSGWRRLMVEGQQVEQGWWWRWMVEGQRVEEVDEGGTAGGAWLVEVQRVEQG